MIEQLARLGFASKAFIYAMVGLLARLIAYAVDQALHGRYRRIRSPIR